jgi:hypothetical protein
VRKYVTRVAIKRHNTFKNMIASIEIAIYLGLSLD